MNAVVDCKKVVDLNNNSDDLGKVESISNVTLEEEESFDAMEAVSNVEEGNDLGLATSEEEIPSRQSTRKLQKLNLNCLSYIVKSKNTANSRPV